MKEEGKAFDFKLFGRLLQYARHYRLVFYFVAFVAIAISGIAILRPYLLKLTIDVPIKGKDPYLLLLFILLTICSLILGVIFQLAFIYYANWLGSTVIRLNRNDLFKS